MRSDGSSTGGFRPDRHPSESYGDILERDSNGVPEHLRQHPRWDEGADAIPITRYYDPEYFAKEVKYLWSKIWQWACREEDIPNPGDYRIYDNVGKSLIVARHRDGRDQGLLQFLPAPRPQAGDAERLQA